MYVAYALDIHGYRQRKNKTSGTQGNHICAPKIQLKFTRKIDGNQRVIGLNFQVGGRW